MNVNSIISLTAGVAIGVAGTLVVDTLINKYYERKEEGLVFNDQEKELINPNDRKIFVNHDQKLELSDLVRSIAEETPQSLADVATEYSSVDYSTVSDTTQRSSIFETAEHDTTEYTKEDKIPPSKRGKTHSGPMDIVQISQHQYLQPTEYDDYDKKTCTWYANDRILAGTDDDLNIMDIASTVGMDIIHAFEQGYNEPVDVLFVSNITCETDYEILQSFGSYEADLKELQDN